MKFTFDQFVHYGRCHSNPAHHVDGMPWSFTFYGYPVTHETNDHYIVGDINFKRGDVALIDDDGGLTVFNR